MIEIAEQDWSFEKIRAADPERAQSLEACGPPEDLIASLEGALSEAIDRDEARLAVDSRVNKFMELRAIVQFPVSPGLYDWFFNARTGYRAQFWISPETGIAFTELIVTTLTAVLAHLLPEVVQVRRIAVESDGGSQQESDVGAMKIVREQFLASLAPDASKIWIGERLYSPKGGAVTDIGVFTLVEAARSEVKLVVPRWAQAINPETKEKAEGLRAPCPVPEISWLDVKGGFLSAEGKPDQIKAQDKRARQIHECGWT